MKCSESWLREWVNHRLSQDELCHTLTMAGLEVEELIPVAPVFSGVIVGHVIKVEKHSEADHLFYCTVEVGHNKTLQIVCGAENVKAGIKVPVAMLNATLPNETVIKASMVRGLASEGMLCSAFELGLSEESQGVLVLPDEAPLGQDIRDYFNLDDYVIDISITPNRGDCLSMRGIARELSALTHVPLSKLTLPANIEPTIKDTMNVTIESKAGCPRYVGRVIRNVKADNITPTWLKERLRRSGIRSINPIVDVTNYVMLELGQPMHAFDLNRLSKEIRVRLSKNKEKIALLDGSEKELDAETLIIADHEKPLAIAGVMGSMDSSVTLLTRDIFLESAYFSPPVIARQRQSYHLNSDSAYRFERGVDPTIQQEAIERATQLILEITGGEAGPLIEVNNTETLPKERTIVLAEGKISQVLGIAIPNAEIETIFRLLQFSFTRKGQDWIVIIPPYRPDIVLYEDLIEEIARIYGYDKIPLHHLKAALQGNQLPEEAKDLFPLRQYFSDRSYHEIISYSFIAKRLQSLLDPLHVPYALVNPLTTDMSVMRTNLWPGLINAMLYNKSHKQQRIRLFEIGTCFTLHENGLDQSERIAGLITGPVFPEQWGQPSRDADFYDLKGDLEGFLCSFKEQPIFHPDTHPALHPGQTAGLYHQGQKLGLLGALHPSVLQALEVTNKVYLFELDLNLLQKTKLGQFHEISKFPEIRRDIAILIKQAIPAREIQDTIKVIAGDWLKDIFIFDVYQGKGISPDHKSIALGLIFQHPTRTLVDDEVAQLMERITTTLKGKLGAELRS